RSSVPGDHRDRRPQGRRRRTAAGIRLVRVVFGEPALPLVGGRPTAAFVILTLAWAPRGPASPCDCRRPPGYRHTFHLAERRRDRRWDLGPHSTQQPLRLSAATPAADVRA